MENVFKGVVEPAPIEKGEEIFEHNAVFRMTSLEMAVIAEQFGEAHACVRPEDILISVEEIHSSAQNSFKGKVVQVAGRRMLCRVVVQVNEFSFLVLVTRTSVERMALQPGSEVNDTFKASAVHIF